MMRCVGLPNAASSGGSCFVAASVIMGVGSTLAASLISSMLFLIVGETVAAGVLEDVGGLGCVSVDADSVPRELVGTVALCELLSVLSGDGRPIKRRIKFMSI